MTAGIGVDVMADLPTGVAQGFTLKKNEPKMNFYDENSFEDQRVKY
jgi:hypothetical protein